MGLLSPVLDHDRVLYIMTLGVVEGQRNRGIASTLISIACQHAYEARRVADRWLGGRSVPHTTRAALRLVVVGRCRLFEGQHQGVVGAR